MAWFECTTGASSGNEVALIVTTDASFAGSNITASNGEDTFTQQCPSSAPYVVTFENIPTGTYTISGVTGGQTVSKTFVVSDYNFEFHYIPTGSTATPVNVIQTWLHCANIWNKTYTTINQVLADTSTLLALISSNNAADYMARSTNWASSVCANQTAMGYIGNNNYCANKLLANSTWLNAIGNSAYMESVLNVKVPVMTSNTTPSGEVIYSSYYNTGYEPYRAFNGNDRSNGWIPSGSESIANSYIGYKFTQDVKIYRARIFEEHNGQTTSRTRNVVFKVQGSNDNSTYNNLSGNLTVNKTITPFTFNFIPSSKYRYIRLKGVSISGALSDYNGWHVQFYGRA